jgi:hypothetical protein
MLGIPPSPEVVRRYALTVLVRDAQLLPPSVECPMLPDWPDWPTPARPEMNHMSLGEFT